MKHSSTNVHNCLQTTAMDSKHRCARNKQQTCEISKLQKPYNIYQLSSYYKYIHKFKQAMAASMLGCGCMDARAKSCDRFRVYKREFDEVS